MSTPIDIRVPDIGEHDSVEVIEILVEVGDSVTAEQSLITLESDKASMEIPSTDDGTVTELLIKIGDKISQGDVFARVSASAATAESTPAAAPESEPAAAATATPSASGGAVSSQVMVPEIGDFEEIEVIEVLVSVGDTVELDQSLITLETDKASMEIPSTVAGKITSMPLSVGDKVSQGDLVAEVAGTGAAAPSQAAAKPDPAPAAAPAPVAPCPAVAAAAAAAAYDGSWRGRVAAMARPCGRLPLRQAFLIASMVSSQTFHTQQTPYCLFFLCFLVLVCR